MFGLFIILFIIFLFLFKNGEASALSSRIIGGKNADIKTYPYQVSLRINGIHACGGSILTVDYILTAAHCTFDTTEKQLRIKAGSSNRTKTGGQIIKVKKIYQHAQFNIDTYDYDVSVLRLLNSLVLGNGVATISLIAQGKEISSGNLCVATGWGSTTNDGYLANLLKVVNLPAITTTQCRTYYGTRITDRMFCAGYPEGIKDTCTGDSGGPLVQNGILVGITSWGHYVCAKAPGVFTKISALRSYIDQIVALG